MFCCHRQSENIAKPHQACAAAYVHPWCTHSIVWYSKYCISGETRRFSK